MTDASQSAQSERDVYRAALERIENLIAFKAADASSLAHEMTEIAREAMRPYGMPGCPQHGTGWLHSLDNGRAFCAHGDWRGKRP